MSYLDIAEFLRNKQKYRPQVGIICGSGLSGLSEDLVNSITINYEDIPGIYVLLNLLINIINNK